MFPARPPMERGILSTTLASENLAAVPPSPVRYTIEDFVLNSRQQNRVSEDQQQLADRVLA